MMMGIFLTGAIRSGTSWVFALLAERISPSYLEQFDYFELEPRRCLLDGHDDFLFKINEDMRCLAALHETFPESKTLVILRHPLESLRSIAQPHPESKPFRPFRDLKEKWVRSGDDGLFPAAIRRLESYFPEETLAILDEGREWLLVVRYDDLLSDFAFTVSRLLAFCGKGSEVPKGFAPKSTPNQGVSLTDFTEEKQDLISSSSLPALCDRLGYSLSK